MTALLEWSEAKSPWESKVNPEGSSSQFWKPRERSSWVLMKSESTSWCLLCICPELACVCGICTLEKMFWIHGRNIAFSKRRSQHLESKMLKSRTSIKLWKFLYAFQETLIHYVLCVKHCTESSFLFHLYFESIFPFNKLNYLKCRRERKSPFVIKIIFSSSECCGLYNTGSW